MPRRLSPSMLLPRRARHRKPIPPRSLIRPSAFLPLGDPAPSTALPPSGRISTRTRRRTAAATGTALPAADYGFGPGGVPRPFERRANSPPRVPRPRRPLVVVTAPAPAASPAPTVPIPSGRDHAEPMGTPLVRLPPLLTSRPPPRPTWMPSALLQNYSSRILPRVIRTLTGRGSNRPSVRATSPCATSFLAGRPYQSSFCGVFRRTSVPPFRRFRGLLANSDHSPPTTASS